MSMRELITLNFTTKGPFDLKRTIESGHSSFPIPMSDKMNRYYMVIKVPETKKVTICRVFQNKTKMIAEILSPEGALEDNEIKSMRKYLRIIFGLDLDLEKFFEEFKNDKLAPAFKVNAGLRLTRAHDLFESLICSILTQNNSVWKFNSQVRKIKELMGEKYPTEHFMIYSFPEPQTLFRMKHLLKDARLGYREEYVINTTEDIANYQFRLEKLNSLPTFEAKKELLKLKGIGTKVADMFLLYGLGRIDAPPTDIWIQRGVCKLLFKGKEKSIEECRDKLLDHYGKWAGLAQLYMFDYMRTNAQNEK
ncbi:MAG: DNA-3-methyladenine glycosylase 2 family protein [Candidatus Heimdallarchaeota archaeon]|nr:DNA-3-methyladenine glycosylase 2 family protein [Candidatus Heimdallarchaeota archaeon]